MLQAFRRSARRTRLADKAGYTLIEILIVLAIIAMIVGLAGPQLMKLFDSSKVKATTVEIAALKNGLDNMQVEIGRYPTEQEGLALLLQSPGQGVPGWNGPYLTNSELKDKWGNDYHYVPAAEGGQPQVVSYGADGKQGGTGNAADIVK